MEELDLLPGSLSDAGNADRLIRWAGANFLHVAGIGWHRWKGSRWRRDGVGEVMEACKDTAAIALRQAKAHYGPILASSPEKSSEYKAAARGIAHFAGMENIGRLRAMRDLAETDLRVAVDNSDIDGNPYLIATSKTTFDAKTCAHRDPTRADLLTVGTDVEPQGEPFHDSRWSQFLAEIQPDPEVREFMQRAIGCSLIGVQRDHVIFFAHGDGQNGKGSFFRAIHAAVGDYYTSIPSSMLMEARNQPHAAQVADLMGKRLVVSSEVARGAKLDEVKVKELTGGDLIKAQFMRENWFSFKPSHTLWICGNDKPKITGTDRGIWRRMRLIPFTQTFAVADRTLDDTLAAEAGIILQWCLDGVVAYMRDGLGECEAIDGATAEYRADQDLLGAAIGEICDTGADLTVAKTQFRAALRKYYEDAGLSYVASDQALKSELARRGIQSVRPTRTDGWCWQGIALKPEIADQLSTADLSRSHRPSWHDR